MGFHNLRWHLFCNKGNAGGYLGLFLGYAVLNIPELVHGAYKWAREKYQRKRQDIEEVVENCEDQESGLGGEQRRVE